jgi:hypothetical protein
LDFALFRTRKTLVRLAPSARLRLEPNAADFFKRALTRLGLSVSAKAIRKEFITEAI